MAITDYSEYLRMVNAPHQSYFKSASSVTATAGNMMSLWTAAPNAGSAPSTAAAPTSATTGAIGQANPSANLYIVEFDTNRAASPTGGMTIVADRLSHQGGLSGTVTTAQTTNLPTAALTRYTSGVGVQIALEIYTQIGATATTVTASYTNQSGTSGRTTPAVDFGGAGDREVGRFIMLPLQQGDTGVLSVESVTVLATTGTAGNFGVTLFKPIFILMLPIGGKQTRGDGLTSAGGQVPEVVDNACLFFLQATGATSTACNLQVSFAEA